MRDLEKMQSLYASVLSKDIVSHGTDDLEVAASLAHMLGGEPAPESLADVGQRKALDFHKLPCRLAYLHACAPLRTEIARRALLSALEHRREMEHPRRPRSLGLCSVGGGPGCDVIGVLSALHEVAPRARIETAVTVVESAPRPWERTFASLLQEFRKEECCGEFARRLSDDAFDWRYIEDDLIRVRSDRAREAVSSSSLVVMNHHLSVLRTGHAESVMDNVFSRMQPGSFALIIDEADDALAAKIARQSGHYQLHAFYCATQSYSFEQLKTPLYGYAGCHRADVQIYLFRKSLYASLDGPASQRSKGPELLCERCFDRDTSAADLLLKRSVRTLRCVVCEDDLGTSSGSGSSCEEGDALESGLYPWKEGKIPLDGIVPRPGVAKAYEKDEPGELEEGPELCRCRLL